MKLSEKLLVLASWLESVENDVLISAEDETEMNVIAGTLVRAASELKKGAEEIKQYNFDNPKFKWTVYNKLEPSESGNGKAKVVAEFEATFDEAEKILKDLAGPGVHRSGDFGKNGGFISYRKDDDSVYILGDAKPVEEKSSLTPEMLEEMAAIATSFSESGDELLEKQASVLDEILLTLAAPKNAIAEYKAAQDKKIDELKKLYQQPRETLKDLYKESDIEKDIKKSDSYKEYRPLEAPLKTRYCPDHAGCGLIRVSSDGDWECSLDGKIYNFEVGFTDQRGQKHPGCTIQNQSVNLYRSEGQAMFSDRAGRVGSG